MEHHQITIDTVSRETFSEADHLLQDYENELDLYLERLLWWNERVNLVSRNVSRETIAEHIRHSLLISNLACFHKATTILDAGTGGGLPGIPLAITHPDKQFILNDIVSKKCLAMKQMVRKLSLSNAHIADGSVENQSLDHPFLLISKHAFKIDELLAMTDSLPWESMILYKGLQFKEELEGIATPLHVTAYDLSEESSFYTDKALVVIQRN